VIASELTEADMVLALTTMAVKPLTLPPEVVTALQAIRTNTVAFKKAVR
jgi:hypothetical protein